MHAEPLRLAGDAVGRGREPDADHFPRMTQASRRTASSRTGSGMPASPRCSPARQVVVHTDSEPRFPHPLCGARVDTLHSGLAPARRVVDGRYVRLEPMRAAPKRSATCPSRGPICEHRRFRPDAPERPSTGLPRYVQPFGHHRRWPHSRRARFEGQSVHRRSDLQQGRALLPGIRARARAAHPPAEACGPPRTGWFRGDLLGRSLRHDPRRRFRRRRAAWPADGVAAESRRPAR